MSSYRNASDLKIATLKRCGELSDGTSDYDADAVTYMNAVYRGIISGGNIFGVECGEPWIWATATSPQILTLQLPYQSGGISVTNGSTTITFSTPPAFSVAGWYLKFESRPDYFVILSHTANSATATIDMQYPDATGSSLVFMAVQLKYALPAAVCRLCAPMITYHDAVLTHDAPEQGKIFEVDYNTFLRKYPLAWMQAEVPQRYAVVARDTDDNITVQFSSFPNPDGIPIRVEVPYIPVVQDLTDSTLSVPVIPLGFRDILLHGAAYYLMLDKSDNRAETEMMLAKTQLQALINHNRKQLSLAGDNYGKLVPRRGNTWRRLGSRGWY